MPEEPAAQHLGQEGSPPPGPAPGTNPTRRALVGAGAPGVLAWQRVCEPAGGSELAVTSFCFVKVCCCS